MKYVVSGVVIAVVGVLATLIYGSVDVVTGIFVVFMLILWQYKAPEKRV